MPYIPHTPDDVRQMLEVIDVESIDALFDEVPEQYRGGRLRQVPEALSEMDVLRLMSERARQDADVLCFIGAGAYEHHIPSAVWDVVTRGEFMTAYTPYQAEASQGTLQVIYEFQSIMAHLTGMDVSNASLYDGASAVAEAVLMAIRAQKKKSSRRILVPVTLHPLYRQACAAIVGNQDVQLVEVDFDPSFGTTLTTTLEAVDDQDFSALIIPQPSFFGTLEDVDALTDWAHARQMLVIGVVNPTSLALLKPPGKWGQTGADIVVGEGQPLGVPLASGGPYFGFMCCKQALVRQMPGRIIGRTLDADGNPGFVLTLQAREQHIRRGKATSNICTNQGLAMTAATIYASLLGAEGLQAVARACHGNTRRALDLLTAIPGVSRAFSAPFFHEVVVRLPEPASRVLSDLESRGIQGGIDLGRYFPGLEHFLLLCATETKTDGDLVRLSDAVQRALVKG